MFGKRKFLLSYYCSDAGSIVPIAAMLFPLIIGMGGVGVDISNWMMQRRILQTSADAAALAGAWELANGGTTSGAEDAALREAVNNGYDPALSGTLLTTVTTDADGVRTVKVDIREKVEVWFSSMFIDTSVYASTTASAEELTAGPFCVLGLDQTEIGAVTAAGSANLDSPTCGIAVNSSSASALSLSGSATMNVGEVRVVGGYAEGGSSSLTYTKMRTNAAPTADPYDDLALPTFTACTSAQQRSGPTRRTANATLNPGTFCGGITVTGNNTITLNPGVYIMDGGDFNVSGGGSITGTGVTIILTNSGGSSYGSYGNMNITGGKTTSLSAPTTGTYAGVAVYQDRNAPESSGNDYNKITGTSGLEVSGVIYTPSRRMDFGGNSRVGAEGSPLCTKLIGKQVMFQGNPSLGSDCTGSGTESIGNATARLVL